MQLNPTSGPGDCYLYVTAFGAVVQPEIPGCKEKREKEAATVLFSLELDFPSITLCVSLFLSKNLNFAIKRLLQT